MAGQDRETVFKGLKDILLEEFDQNAKVAAATEDTDIHNDLEVDSLGFHNVVMDVEAKFNIEISAQELTDLPSTLGGIVDLILDAPELATT